MTAGFPAPTHYTYLIDPRFTADLEDLSPATRERVFRAISRLSDNPKHPSLNSKKARASSRGDIWRARIDDANRLLYQWADGCIYLWRAGNHDMTDEARKLDEPDLRRAQPAPRPAVQPEQRAPARPAAPPEHALPGVLHHFDPITLRILGVPEAAVEAVRALPDIEGVWDLDLPADVQTTLYDIFTNPEIPAAEILFDPARLLYRETADRLEGYCKGRIKRLLLNLEPEQEQFLKIRPRGPFLLRGVAGSGKTTIGLYRAKTRAEQRDLFSSGGRVLYLTYNATLTNAVDELFRELYGELPAGIEVSTVDRWLMRFLRDRGRPAQIDSQRTDPLLDQAIHAVAQIRREPVLSRGRPWFANEFEKVIEGRSLTSRAAYLEADRAGTGSALGAPAREAVWAVYEHFRAARERAGFDTWGSMRLAALAELRGTPPPLYDEVIVDEAQDLVPAQLLAVRLLAAGESLFLLADAAQSIYYRGISWRDAGIEISGRTRVLRTNHRNSQEVLRAAASLIAASSSLRNTDEFIAPEASRRRGPRPQVAECEREQEQTREVVQRVLDLCSGERKQRYRPGDVAVLAPTSAVCQELHHALFQAGIPCRLYRNQFSVLENEVKVITIHSAKGLEFPAVVIAGLTHGGRQSRDFPYTVPADAGPRDRQVLLDEQRRLLYVGMTRAAERLYLITVRGLRSPFLNDIEPGSLRTEQRTPAAVTTRYTAIGAASNATPYR